VVAQRTLNPFAQVRALARQPIKSASESTNSYNYVNNSAIKSGNKNPDSGNKNTLHDYRLFKSLKQDLSLGTIGFYDDKIIPFIKDYPNLDKVTPVDITNWIASRKTFNKKTGLLEKTNNQSAYYRALRSFFNWRENYYNLESNANPFHKLKPPKKEIKIMPALKLKQIELAIKTANNTRDKAIISLFAESGMRLSELIGIEYENIDFEGMNIKILGKGKKWRLAPIGGLSKAYLTQYLTENNITAGKIWKTRETGKNITIETIESLFNKISKKLGFHINPHQFRRSFVVLLKEKGVPITDIKEYGGWTNLSMPEHYGKTYEYEQARKHYKAPLADLDIGLPTLNP
jgi:integrase